MPDTDADREEAIWEAHVLADSCEACGEFHPDLFMRSLLDLGYQVVKVGPEP